MVIQRTLSPAQARRVYDRIGRHHDLARIYEAKAVERALSLLDPGTGERIADLGAGTGGALAEVARAVGPRGLALGIDISPVMLGIAGARSGAPVVRADLRRLPLADGTLDAVITTYLLDLVPGDELDAVIAECARVLRAGGRLVHAGLTDGVTPRSRATMALWSAVHRLRPTLVGGCRPLLLVGRVAAAGLQPRVRQVIVERGVPSELIVAVR